MRGRLAMTGNALGPRGSGIRYAERGSIPSGVVRTLRSRLGGYDSRGLTTYPVCSSFGTGADEVKSPATSVKFCSREYAGPEARRHIRHMQPKLVAHRPCYCAFRPQPYNL